MVDCTEYSSEGDLDSGPCQCPVCKGWLKWVYNEADGEYQPICNKCRTPLIKIPDAEASEDCDWGKICALKPLENNPKEQQKEEKP
jgi:hypothetical protein